MHMLCTSQVHMVGLCAAHFSLSPSKIQKAKNIFLTVLRVAINHIFVLPKNAYIKTLISNMVGFEGELMRGLGKLMRLHP